MKFKKEPTTLAIDTSCDETSVAVVRGLTVLSNVLPSQIKFHKKYGGVVPSIAKLYHEKRINNVVKEALKRSGLGMENIDAIAVTIGPGLAIALEVGIKKAKELAKEFKKPLITVNHMEGHLLSSLASAKGKVKGQKSKSIYERIHDKENMIPVLGFLISGGHTELVEVNEFLGYKKIGDTLDDSCGEAYDKCGRIIGFGYPAGPVITEFAKRHRKNMLIYFFKRDEQTLVKAVNKKSKAEYLLPIPLARSKELNFSFSGLKTAFRKLVFDLSGLEISQTEERKGASVDLKKGQYYDLCVVFEAAALKHLEMKLELALQSGKYSEVWIGGGVTASARLRHVLRAVCKKHGLEMKFPYSNKLTGDNGAMIGVASNTRIAKLEGINKLKKILASNPEAFEKADRDPVLSL